MKKATGLCTDRVKQLRSLQLKIVNGGRGIFNSAVDSHTLSGPCLAVSRTNTNAMRFYLSARIGSALVLNNGFRKNVHKKYGLPMKTRGEQK